MSVCLRCGAQLSLTDKFCGLCGNPTKRQTRDQQTTSNNQAGNKAPPQIRTMEELIGEINRLLVYFSKAQSLYDEYESCKKSVKELKAKRKSLKFQIHKDKDTHKQLFF